MLIQPWKFTVTLSLRGCEIGA